MFDFLFINVRKAGYPPFLHIGYATNKHQIVTLLNYLHNLIEIAVHSFLFYQLP